MYHEKQPNPHDPNKPKTNDRIGDPPPRGPGPLPPQQPPPVPCRASEILVAGSSLPSSWLPFAQQAFTFAQTQAGITEKNTSALNGVPFAVLGDSISSLFGNEWQNVVSARTGMVLTEQDARPGRAFSTAFECYGATTPGATLGTFNPSYTYPSVGGTCAGNMGNTTEIP